MDGLDMLYVALAAWSGTVFGSIVGWLRNKVADSTVVFKWDAFTLSILLGVGAALLYAIGLTEEVTAAGLISAFLGGTGLGYVIPKTVGAIKG